jgi:hypothetical protein
VWSKESRDPEREAHICVVPGQSLTGAGYNWEITVFIDDKEAWSCRSGPLQGRPLTRATGIDCAASGRLVGIVKN